MTETILNKNPAKSADLGEEILKAIEERCSGATVGPWRVKLHRVIAGSISDEKGL